MKSCEIVPMHPGPKTAQEVNFKREEFSSHVLIFCQDPFVMPVSIISF